MDKNLEKIADLIGTTFGDTICSFILKQPHGSELNVNIKKPVLNFKVSNDSGKLKIDFFD